MHHYWIFFLKVATVKHDSDWYLLGQYFTLIIEWSSFNIFGNYFSFNYQIFSCTQSYRAKPLTYFILKQGINNIPESLSVTWCACFFFWFFVAYKYNPGFKILISFHQCFNCKSSHDFPWVVSLCLLTCWCPRFQTCSYSGIWHIVFFYFLQMYNFEFKSCVIFTKIWISVFVITPISS